MDAKLKIAMTALRNITKVPRSEFDMTTVAKIAQTAFCDIDAIAQPVAAGSVDTPEFRKILNEVVMCKSSIQIECNARLLEHLDTWGTQQHEAGYHEGVEQLRHERDSLLTLVTESQDRAEKAEARLAHLEHFFKHHSVQVPPQYT